MTSQVVERTWILARAVTGGSGTNGLITKLEGDGNSTDEHVPSGDLPQPPQILKYKRNTSVLNFERLNGLNGP